MVRTSDEARTLNILKKLRLYFIQQHTSNILNQRLNSPRAMESAQKYKKKQKRIIWVIVLTAALTQLRR